MCTRAPTCGQLFQGPLTLLLPLLPLPPGREPGAPVEAAQLGEERSSELSSLVNAFILRRTNKLLSEHLPPKVVSVVCCSLTPLQRALYEHFLHSNATRRLLSGSKATGVLSAITCLKKLCNSPKLIYDAVHSKAAVREPGGGVALTACALSAFSWRSTLPVRSQMLMPRSRAPAPHRVLLLSSPLLSSPVLSCPARLARLWRRMATVTGRRHRGGGL